MYLFSGFLKFLLGAGDRYYCDMQGKEWGSACSTGQASAWDISRIEPEPQDVWGLLVLQSLDGRNQGFGGKWGVFGGRFSMWSKRSDLGVGGAWPLERDAGIGGWESRAMWTGGVVLVWHPTPKEREAPRVCRCSWSKGMTKVRGSAKFY